MKHEFDEKHQLNVVNMLKTFNSLQRPQLDDNPANDLLISDVKCSLDNHVDNVSRLRYSWSSAQAFPFTECSQVLLWKMPAWGMNSSCWNSLMTCELKEAKKFFFKGANFDKISTRPALQNRKK